MAIMTAAGLRARVPALADEDQYPDADIDEAIAAFTEIAESYRGVAYEPTVAVETVTVPDGYAWSTLQLRRPKVISITGLTVAGAVLDPLDYTPTETGLLVSETGFTGAVAVTYTHGYVAPPVRLQRACRLYVRATLLADASGVSRDAISQSVDGMTFRYSTPSWEHNRPTGFIDVDAILNGLPDYRMPGIA